MKTLSFLRIMVSILLILFIFSLTSPAQMAPSEGKTRIWIEFKPGKHPQIQQALQGMNAEVHYVFDHLNAMAVSLPAGAILGLQHNPNIVLIEEDAVRFPIEILKGAAPLILSPQQVPYGIDMVQARDIWDANRDGVVDSGAPTASNRKICVIDSGIDKNHEDFQGITVSGYAGNLAWDQDGYGHGTHVTGTLAAMNNALGVVGVTPGTVQLYIVRVFGDNGGWAYSSTLVDAANRCAAAGANIISMSLGGDFAISTEQRAFDSLYAAGILSVAAAGNGGNSRVSYPAGYASVVSVAAIDSNKTVASFSQRNSDVELSAPGVGVLSTVPGNSYEYYSGTSMATPHVSAVAALVWSANPSWTNAQIRSALTTTALDLGSAGKDNSYGYGLVQAKAALNLLNGGGSAGTLQLSVSTNKSSYVNRETVSIYNTVVNQNGIAVASASVSVTIKNALGITVSSRSCTTGGDGKCTVTYKIDTRKTGAGTFSVVSQASKPGYTGSSANAAFQVLP